MSPVPPPILRYRDVTVRYNDHDRPAIDRLDLDVHIGERVALVGPSGAGKSTIIHLAGGLVLPSSGSIEVLGIDTRRLGRRAHRSTRARIASIHQDLALVGPLRAAQNVAAGRLGRWSTTEALRALVRPRDLDEIHATLADVGIPEKLWERTDQLSGGQQQRVAIARALFQDADLLLADEPVSALDPARSAAVMKVLADPRRDDEQPGRTMVASLHDAPLALACCDRVVGLRHGRVEFDLPAEAIDEQRLTDLYLLDGA